jgi:hypothetical protein
VIADSEESRKYLQDAGIDDAEIADTSFFDKHKNDGLKTFRGFDPTIVKIIIFADATRI